MWLRLWRNSPHQPLTPTDLWRTNPRRPPHSGSFLPLSLHRYLSPLLSLSLPWLSICDPSNQQLLMSIHRRRSFRECRIRGEVVLQLSNRRRWWWCTVRGRLREERWQNAISGHPYHRLWVQISSPWIPLHNGTVHSRRKCPDQRHVLLYKLMKLWQLIRAKQSLILK